MSTPIPPGDPPGNQTINSSPNWGDREPTTGLITVEEQIAPQLVSGAYCSPEEFLVRFDLRTVADLLGDNGKRFGVNAAGPTPTDPDPVLVAANLTLIALLQDASGMVEMACTKGARYDPTDLWKIYNAPYEVDQATGRRKPNTNIRNTLITIVAGIAMWFLTTRRPNPNIPISPRCQMAMQLLDRIAIGELVFGTVDAQQAGLPEAKYLTVDDQNVMNLATFRAERYFGRRNNRDRLRS